ncbi:MULTISPECIES: hypothetical protein [unclassified Maribacter]|uniref:hypothetical protein n=1 Tax=unclassified Maribacter TaxID=2615042 RepID=UPI0013E09AAE|nr:MULTISPECIES: hypothetical protein [unclassified Maribacter]
MKKLLDKETILKALAISLGVVSYDYFSKGYFDWIKLIFILVFSFIVLSVYNHLKK